MNGSKYNNYLLIQRIRFIGIKFEIRNIDFLSVYGGMWNKSHEGQVVYIHCKLLMEYIVKMIMLHYIQSHT
jgi:hypothetical protein